MLRSLHFRPLLIVVLLASVGVVECRLEAQAGDEVVRWAAEGVTKDNLGLSDSGLSRSSQRQAVLVTRPAATEPRSPLIVSDVSGDGVPDVIAVRSIAGTTLERIEILTGRSLAISTATRTDSGGLASLRGPLFGGAVDAGISLSNASRVELLEAVDVDGDGDRDLLLAETGARSFSVVRNRGLSVDRTVNMSRTVQTVLLPAPLLDWRIDDVGRADGIDDLVVTVAGHGRSEELLFQSAQGLIAATPVRLEAQRPVTRGRDEVPLSRQGATLGRGEKAVEIIWPLDASAPLAVQTAARGVDYSVDSSLDDGDASPGDNICATAGAVCTLRAAVEEANAFAGVQTIGFAGSFTISPASGIVTTAPLVISAGTGATVEINGDSLPGTCALQIEGGASTLRGLVFSGVCVELETGDGNTVVDNYFGVNKALDTSLDNVTVSVFSSDNIIGGTDAGTERNYFGAASLRIGQGTSCADGNRVIGNYFGVRADGATPVDADAAAGVTVTGVASDGGGDCEPNEIGGTAPGEGNVISGSLTAGITTKSVTLSGGRGTLVQGNQLGATADGTARLAGTKETGVSVTGGVNALIGGTVAAASNTIAGNEADFLFAFGVHVFGGGSTGTMIQGNKIGTNALGTAAISDFEHGVYIENASDVTVGGTDPGAGNVISGNDRDGVHIARFGGTPISRNVVAGNVIGLNADATGAIPNGEDGIEMTNLAGNGVDTTVRVESNTIGGNLQQGVEIDRVGITPKDIVIIGNIIGTDSSGTLDLGNDSHGILIDEADDNTVGGTAAGEANTIAFNGGDGVRITENQCCFDGNTVTGNSIYDNDGGGIGLSGGTNDGQEPPELTEVYESPIVVTGTFDEATDSATTLEFFANTACDGSGAGEGRRHLGSATVASGVTNFSVNVAGTLATGEIVTATSTDADGNTSFFSDCATAVTQDPIFSDGFESGNTSAWSSTVP